MERKLQKSEISKILGLNKSTVRYYEQIGLIHPSIDDNNYRSYGIEELKALSQIAFMRDIDIDLEKIKSIFHDDYTDTQDLLIQKSNELKDTIKKYESNLIKIEEIIEFSRLKEQNMESAVVTVPERYLYRIRPGHSEIDSLLRENQSYFIEHKLSVGEWFIKSMDSLKFLNNESLDFEEHLLVENNLESEYKKIPQGRYMCYNIVFEDNDQIEWNKIIEDLKVELSKKSLIRRTGDVLFINKDNMHFNFKESKRILSIQVPVD